MPHLPRRPRARPLSLVAVAVAAAALAAPAGAWAGDVEVDNSDGVLSILGSGTHDQVGVANDGSVAGNIRVLALDADTTLTPFGGCDYAPGDGSVVTCPGDAIEKGDLELFAGDDRIRFLRESATWPWYIDGGDGDDDLVDGHGDDEVHGGEGSDRIDNSPTGSISDASGTGDDLFYGDGGDDDFTGGTGGAAVGTNYLDGGPGNDRILGGIGIDIVRGGDGADVVRGGLGTDDVDGGAGDDQLFGMGDDDVLTDRSGTDSFDGGDGNDRLFSDDGAGGDTLRCGFGSDVARADSGDTVASGTTECDTIDRVGEPAGPGGTGTPTGGTTGGTGGTGGGTPGPAVLAAPALSGAKTQHALRKRRIVVGATCTVACALEAGGTVTVPGIPRVYKLKAVATAGAAGRPVTLKLKLPKALVRAARRALKRHDPVVARLKVTAASGSTATVSRRKVRIKA